MLILSNYQCSYFHNDQNEKKAAYFLLMQGVFHFNICTAQLPKGKRRQIERFQSDYISPKTSYLKSSNIR